MQLINQLIIFCFLISLMQNRIQAPQAKQILEPEPIQAHEYISRSHTQQTNFATWIKNQQMIFLQQQNRKQQKSQKVGHYILNRSIGSGSFGKVFIGMHLITGEKVAIKMIQKQRITSKFIERVKREIKVMCRLHHPSIIQLYEIVQQKKQIYLIMEYAPHGQLFNHIVQNKKLPQEQACFIFQQLVSGVQYFHKLGIAHRDLKPQNILFDENKRIKIIDFGLSNTYQKNQKLSTACGSPCYVAPEMIHQKCSYDPLKSDIWSIGIILYAMLCGCLPFMDNNPKKIYEKIKLGHFKVPKTLSNEAKNLIARMLCVDPQKRIELSEIRSHKWWRNCSQVKLYGIQLPRHEIPVQPVILQKMKSMSVFATSIHTGNDIQKIKAALKKNLHIPQTATYYLLLRKYVRDGNNSFYYLGCPTFDPSSLNPEQYCYQDVDSAQVPPYLPPNRSTIAPLQPQDQNHNFQIFMPWEELYYRVAQLTELKNNHFLRLLLQKNRNKNNSPIKFKINRRSRLSAQKYSSGSKNNERVSVELPSIPKLSNKKSTASRNQFTQQKRFPLRYSGYRGNLSQSQMQKLTKIGQHTSQGISKKNLKLKNQQQYYIPRSSHKIGQKVAQNNQIQQLIQLLEKIAIGNNQPNKNSQAQSFEGFAQVHTKKQQKMSIRYKVRSRRH